MDINSVIAAIKERCASFDGNVAGAAEYKRLPETANLDMPAAYVIPMDDEVGEQASNNGYRQPLTDAIAVVVVLSNAVDERGQGSITSVRAIRSELWKGLLGWEPDTDHGPISYEGGNLIDLDRARLYYQFEFSAETEIAEEDTWRATRNAALPPLTTTRLTVDEPAGTTEVSATLTHQQ
ncbi:MAG: hypothetical protein COX55_03505 [Zetaproteobacteria bacterium CG23_combo_of_CG06-09_8_20_14_all_54_7]|nr:MAG: hypothetical protein COX55_03505 [Zetaproteobacteria bacterium CG23_combo_of_CG06-09_8_20_14_all_54_7]